MGLLTEIKNRIEYLVSNSEISQVRHDRLDSINEDSKNNYPLLIWRDTNFKGSDLRKSRQYTTQTIDFYLSDLHFQGNTDTVAEKKDYLRTLLKELITNIPDYENAVRLNTFEVVDSYSGESGYEQHNDELVIIKITADIVSFECITKL
jgi:hypothetical protein